MSINHLCFMCMSDRVFFYQVDLGRDWTGHGVGSIFDGSTMQFLCLAFLRLSFFGGCLLLKASETAALVVAAAQPLSLSPFLASSCLLAALHTAWSQHSGVVSYYNESHDSWQNLNSTRGASLIVLNTCLVISKCAGDASNSECHVMRCALGIIQGDARRRRPKYRYHTILHLHPSLPHLIPVTKAGCQLVTCTPLARAFPHTEAEYVGRIQESKYRRPVSTVIAHPYTHHPSSTH